jgi:hypothetical protein
MDSRFLDQFLSIFEEYVVMEGEDIIEAEYCMSELVDMALGQRLSQLVWTLLLRP